MGFTQVFGGTTIYPSDTTYLFLPMVADITLAWPIEQQVSGDVVADIIDVDAGAPGLNINLPDARQVTTGYTALFNNVGANTVTVRSATGATLVSLTSGTVWQLYLTDNSTEGGTWKVFQYGASVSVVNAAALAGAGLKAIGTSLNQAMPVTLSAITPLTLVDADRARALIWTGGVGAWTLPAPASVGNDWFVELNNAGTGDLTVTPASGLIQGAANLTVAAGKSATVFTDGSDYYVQAGGTGSGGGSGFDFVTIDVSGAGDFPLTGVNLNRIGYRFVGTLSGTRNIIVPNAIQEYWVANATTGAFNLFVKTALQTPGVQVLANNQAILYCDGTNVIPAESSTVSFPIPVAQGGTGAVNATAARTNLGATATGSALFTAASASAGLATLGGVPTSRVLTAGAGLGGGGDLSADRSFNVDIPAQPQDTTPDIAADLLLSYDNSAAALRRVLIRDILRLPQNSQSGSYTLGASDAQKHILHPAGSGLGHTYTIPSNASVPFPIGTMVTFVNRDASNGVTIAITSDTLTLAGSGAVGSRTLAPYGEATILKINTTEWIISGTGVY